jgi:hypothetical protein
MNENEMMIIFKVWGEGTNARELSRVNYAIPIKLTVIELK